MTEGPKLDPGLMFEVVYETLPAHLAQLRDALRTELAGAAAAVVGHNEPVGDVGPMGNTGHMGQMGQMDKGA